MADASPSDPLTPLRKRIDEIDQQLVALLNERANVVVEVGRVKTSGASPTPIYAPDREQEVYARVRRMNQGPLPDSCIEAIWRELMSGSFALERPLRIGFFGAAGSFTHLAARRKFGASVEYDSLATIPAVFEEVSRGHVDLGVVPVENSTEGSVNDTLDSFFSSSVRICAEVLIAVRHNLLAACPLKDVKKVYSHPQALAQCSKWLSAQLPDAERMAAGSTSRAAAQAAKEPGAAAIASDLAAELYNLETLFRSIEDNPENTTRFVVIGKQQGKPTGDDKTALMFTTQHKTGALAEVLNVFGAHKLNMTFIHERPSQKVNWEYWFFVDVEGHAEDPQVQAAVAAAREHCLQLNVLGSFPRATQVL